MKDRQHVSARRASGVMSLGWAILAFLVLLVAMPCRAELADVRAVMAQRLAAAKTPFSPASVTETLIPGLYRWDQGKDIGQIYVNEAATLLLYTNGLRITAWEQPVRHPQPISEAEKSALLSEMIKNIRFDKLIRLQRGNPTNRVLLVSAFDCPVCIQFERMLDAGNDIDVDMYVLPSTLHPDKLPNVSTVRNIWCASDNALQWHTAVKNAVGYFRTPNPACELELKTTRDIHVLLNTLGLFKGYPFMIFGNGQVGTPSVDRARFVTQLQLNGGKAFWSDPKPDKYAHFRASTSAPAKSVTVRPLDGLFQRAGRPGQGATEVPANRDDPS